MRTINSWAIPVIRYTFASLNWLDSELRKLDETTVKLLKSHGHMAKGAITDWLYLS